MATIQDNINRIKQAKADIKEAIISKGVEVEDDVRIDGYAEKIGEIQQGGGQFAIDFGEEIAGGNPAFMGALQDDIDYYNQIQEERRLYAEGKGGRSDSQILTDQEFKDKIAWWPKGMTKNTSCISYCKNLLYITDWVMPSNVRNTFDPYYRLKLLQAGGSIATGRLYGFCNLGSVGTIDVSLNNVTEVQESFKSLLCQSMTLSFPSASGTIAMAVNHVRYMKRADISIPLVTNVTYFINSCLDLEELYLYAPSLVSQLYSIGYNSTRLRIAHISGFQYTLSLGTHSNLQLESVKYILDNCQARADGAAYTLTLHADVKAAFMAKCTEGDENYDAEYAATLAAANAKGLTIA